MTWKDVELPLFPTVTPFERSGDPGGALMNPVFVPLAERPPPTWGANIFHRTDV